MQKLQAEGRRAYTNLCTVFNTRGVLISPQPDLLPIIFCLMVKIFRQMVVLLYIYIYKSSTNIPPVMIINRIYEHQNLLFFIVAPCILTTLMFLSPTNTTLYYTYKMLKYLMIVPTCYLHKTLTLARFGIGSLMMVQMDGNMQEQS